jgi:hypothetical protein
VSTQKAADTDACFSTYGSAVVQLLIEENGTTTAPPPVTVTTITEMLTTSATSDTFSLAPVVTPTKVVVVTETLGGFWKKNIRGWCGYLRMMWGRQPPTWNQSCQGVARPRQRPRGLPRGRAAFTEGERCTGGLLGCGALVVVGFFGASTIGLAAIGFAS